MTEHVIVNGSRRPWRPELRIDGLLEELLPAGPGAAADRPSAGVAVAVNEAVIPRRQWPELVIAAGDRIEIVTAVQGG